MTHGLCARRAICAARRARVRRRRAEPTRQADRRHRRRRHESASSKQLDDDDEAKCPTVVNSDNIDVDDEIASNVTEIIDNDNDVRHVDGDNEGEGELDASRRSTPRQQSRREH